ncbi:hypothetical protein AAHE18_18G202300 [Arachis hypogaea]|nr:uncharacterized protein DS421_18g629030 [Arachis hypogaea]
MARNGVTRATTMLIIGMFICFAIAEFHNTILEEPLSPLNYYIATADEELAKCIAECNRRFLPGTMNSDNCIRKCHAKHKFGK